MSCPCVDEISRFSRTIHAVIQPSCWRRIETLAEALMRQPCLTGSEIVTLLTTIGANPLQLDLLADEFE